MAWSIGIDLGGTKIAGGVIDRQNGAVLARQRVPANPARGGEPVLLDVLAMARSLAQEGARLGCPPDRIGVGIAELVGLDGKLLSEATFAWRKLDALPRIAAVLPAVFEADVRAAARAEARWGAGAGLSNFLYVTIGTGISCCLIMDGEPYRGARGLTGTFASARGLIPLDDDSLAEGPPLEHFAAGPGLASRHPSGDAQAVVRCAERGDAVAYSLLTDAARAIGASVAQLVNVLDPAAVIVGGGLGLAGGVFHGALESAFRAHLWADLHTDIPFHPAKLGPDAGWIGAALAAGQTPPC